MAARRAGRRGRSASPGDRSSGCRQSPQRAHRRCAPCCSFPRSRRHVVVDRLPSRSNQPFEAQLLTPPRGSFSTPVPSLEPTTQFADPHAGQRISNGGARYIGAYTASVTRRPPRSREFAGAREGVSRTNVRGHGVLGRCQCVRCLEQLSSGSRCAPETSRSTASGRRPVCAFRPARGVETA